MTLACNERLSLIEETLNTLVKKHPNEPHARLFQAARYSLLAKSKRLRPLLVLLTAEDLGADIKQALMPACALELIHTYSLIHDDLPCMDDDDFRRGKPSLHIAFGEGDAVLAGDYLLTLAFQVLSEAPHLSDSQKIELIKIVSSRAGSDGMIGGQVADLALKPDIEWNHLEWVHEKKTGALFAAALECGGIVASASDRDLEYLRRAGFAFGIAFQILDDLEDDVTLSTDTAPSAISALGKERAASYASFLIESACSYLDKLSFPAPQATACFKHLRSEDAS